MSQVYSIYSQACGPSGYEHAVSLRLTPSCLTSSRLKVIRNLVLAKGNAIAVYDVCVDTAKPLANGYTNGEVNGTAETAQKTTLIHVRDHLLHGIVTGLQRIRIDESDKDGLHRLLVSFRDAKMAILEWSTEINDLVPVSLHSYERLPQIAPILGEGATGHPLLRADPGSRCAALLLPAAVNTSTLSTVAILPLTRDAEDEALTGTEEELDELHYSPSYTIDLQTVIDIKIARIQDFCFLPGFTEPTLAVLYQSIAKETWTSRLENSRDSFGLVMLTLASATPTVILDCPHPLPYSSSRIFPCPPQLGGVVVLTADALVHVDQAAKVTGCATNGWHKRSSTLALPSGDTLGIGLEGANLAFLSPILALLITRTGYTYTVTMERDGRSLSAVLLSPSPVIQTVSPSSLEVVGREFLFIANAVGDSVLLRWSIEGEDADDAKAEEEMDVDDGFEAALYGTSSTNENGKPIDVRLSIADSLPAYGSIRSVAMGSLEAEETPELLACTGGLEAGRLTGLYRGIPPRKRRKLDVDTSPNTRVFSAKLSDNESALFVSDDASTQIWRMSSEGELRHEHTESHRTVDLSVNAYSSQLIWTTDSDIHLLGLDLSESDDPLPLQSSSSVRNASFASSHLLVTSEDGTRALYDVKDSSISAVSSNLPSDLAAACLFATCSDAFTIYSASTAPISPIKPSKANHDAMAVDDEDAALYEMDGKRESGASSRFTAQRIMASVVPDDSFHRGKALIARLSNEGKLEIVMLPGGKVVFSSEGVLDLPDAIVDGHSVDRDEEAPRVEPPGVESFALVEMGQSRKRPYMLLLLDNGMLSIYEAILDLGTPFRRPESGLQARFVKVLAQRVEARAEGAAPRSLTSFANLRGMSGVFLAGPAPLWLLAPDRGPVRAFAAHVYDVASFSSLSSTDYLIANSTGLHRYELPDLHYDRPVPWIGVVDGKSYAHVVYDSQSQTFICSGNYAAPFCLFDDEGMPLWEADATDLLGPETVRSSLELMIPGTWDVVDGYEFRENESVLSLTSVSANTFSTTTGKRQYICAGTIIDKGEDTPSKGAIYMFEVIPFLNEGEGLSGERVRAEPAAWNRKLVLRFTEDLKSAIGCVDAVAGYVMHSMGQKIFAKRWMDDERLLPVGFADVAFHTTAIKPFKNFLLIGDQVRGLSFYGFQEEPYKLALLGKDTRSGTINTADFLAYEDRVAFAVTDEKGIIRVLEYNPTHVESRAGEKLLLRTEFETGTEISSTILFGRRLDLDSPAQQSGILLAGIDGSLATLLPVREPVYRRLNQVETQLQRHAPNRPCGLNPRAFRSVRNDFVSRALTKGILDGALLAHFASLPLDRQNELTERAGTDADTVALNLGNARSPWCTA